jgi:hypothetical protein
MLCPADRTARPSSLSRFYEDLEHDMRRVEWTNVEQPAQLVERLTAIAFAIVVNQDVRARTAYLRSIQAQ